MQQIYQLVQSVCAVSVTHDADYLFVTVRAWKMRFVCTSFSNCMNVGTNVIALFVVSIPASSVYNKFLSRVALEFRSVIVTTLVCDLFSFQGFTLQWNVRSL